jgi:hypothetical protein
LEPWLKRKNRIRRDLPKNGRPSRDKLKLWRKLTKLIKSDEPAGEKLKTIVNDHGAACDEIKEKLASSEGNSTVGKS